ncbi:MAG TPA: Clp protease N-terminal domain-containing protein [Solirubrobacteraceae bacterium]
MLERQHELEHARADLNHQIRRLHAAGGSLREISDKLGVSHQRVHQIVANGEDVSDPLLRRLGGGLQQSLGGEFSRFTEGARTVVSRSLEDATKRGASIVEPEHLLLALASPEAGPSARVLTAAGATHDTLRVALEHTQPSGQQAETPKARASFSTESKKALELSLQEALHRGDNYIGSQHLLLGVLRGDRGRVQALLDTVDVPPDAIRDAVDAL